MEKRTVNDDCLLWSAQYSPEVKKAVARLNETGAEGDTVRIDCPKQACGVWLEKYVQVSKRNSGRQIRTGVSTSGQCEFTPDTS